MWIETISSEEELRAAVEGAAPTGLPIVTTMSFDTAGRTMMGITPQGFGALTARLDRVPDAIGANCGVGAAELVATVLGITEARPDAIVVAKGNCGIPQFVDGHIHYSGTPELMADYARLVRDAGARIIGGCCGTGPEHLVAMRAALEAHIPGNVRRSKQLSRALVTYRALRAENSPAAAIVKAANGAVVEITDSIKCRICGIYVANSA